MQLANLPAAYTVPDIQSQAVRQAYLATVEQSRKEYIQAKRRANHGTHQQLRRNHEHQEWDLIK
jgi:hypothetical protein